MLHDRARYPCSCSSRKTLIVVLHSACAVCPCIGHLLRVVTLEIANHGLGLVRVKYARAWTQLSESGYLRHLNALRRREKQRFSARQRSSDRCWNFGTAKMREYIHKTFPPSFPLLFFLFFSACTAKQIVSTSFPQHIELRTTYANAPHLTEGSIIQVDHLIIPQDPPLIKKERKIS
jgi:hypothetical protein